MEDGNYFKTIGSEIYRDLNLTRIRVYPNLKKNNGNKEWSHNLSNFSSKSICSLIYQISKKNM